MEVVKLNELGNVSVARNLMNMKLNQFTKLVNQKEPRKEF